MPRLSWGAKAVFSKKSPCRRIENFRTERKEKWTLLRRIDLWSPMFDVSGYRCKRNSFKNRHSSEIESIIYLYGSKYLFKTATARTLHKLTEVKFIFNWAEDCQKSFNSLKQALTTSPVLIYPWTDEDFILDTDASNEGIGAVLS
ncbi:retrovirus-related Pol polyprotein from transposon 297 [Nephila pilipes]|uniref:Retrovirus-related Pol polyprotein from transposon 297 n=1 Tax=Nephila pilipes TaxID=299642 RepID=A0A8X6PDV6_NEPPI|nr:retrovirus-related Pol polyprotein from transposon 297 [Nephila pilipes]